MGTGTFGGGRSSNQMRKLGADGIADLWWDGFDNGLFFWDTADGYGSHDAIKMALKKIPREKVTIQTKTTARTADAMKADLDRFRQEMGTDYIDIVLLHSRMSPKWDELDKGPMEVLAEAKEKNLRIAGEPLVALAWLGGEPEFQRTKPIWGDDLHPLWGVALQRDEGAFLLQALRTPGKLPAEAVNWIVTRLGELKERRAVSALAQQLQNQSSDVVRSAQEALIRIGGSEVASAAKALLDGKGPAPAREAALNILYGLNGPESLPYLRKAISDDNLRTTALFLLGNVGTAQDLKVLAPMSDFWTGDRQWHYWFMLATAEIRERNP